MHRCGQTIGVQVVRTQPDSFTLLREPQPLHRPTQFCPVAGVAWTGFDHRHAPPPRPLVRPGGATLALSRLTGHQAALERVPTVAVRPDLAGRGHPRQRGAYRSLAQAEHGAGADQEGDR